MTQLNTVLQIMQSASPEFKKTLDEIRSIQDTNSNIKKSYRRMQGHSSLERSSTATTQSMQFRIGPSPSNLRIKGSKNVK